MEDDNNQPAPRRIMARRGRAGFSAGSSTHSESLRTPVEHEPDEIDDLLDPDEVHDRIVSNAARLPAPRSSRPPQHAAPPPPPSGMSPMDRMHAVAQAGDANYSKEYRLLLLRRLLVRNVPIDQIAAQLGVSISTIQKDRIELKAMLRQHARELNIDEIIGGQQNVYDELRGMSLRIATENDTPKAMQLAAIRTTLATEADRTRFLNTAGVFDTLRYRKADDGTDVSDVQRLMQSTDNMLSQLLQMELPDEEPSAPRAKRVARTRPGGFNKMTMDDTNASSGDSEQVEL